MKNLLEAAEDYTKQAGRSGALRSHMHPAGGEIPGAGRAAHTGDGGKTGTPRILLQKMRGRAGCGPAMMDARS